MKRITKYKYVVAVCALSMLTACNFEEVNTNQFEMTPEEGLMDGFAVGGLITKMERTVFPIGTAADDTRIINEYQNSYHLSGDVWSGFFGQNNNWGGNSHTQLYLMDKRVATTYASAYTNVLDPWKRLKADSEENDTPEVFALAQVIRISAWHKALECFGPIPYTHAGEPTMYIPFDSEETVYRTMFEDLTAAIAELTNNANNGVKVMPNYDAVYAGDATKWVKYANSLMLRLAIRVRFADETLAKTYAKQALEHPIGVMSSKDDEAKIVTGAAGQAFRNNINWLSDNYNEARMGSSIYSYLVGYKDPRLSAYFQPTTQSDYGAIVGSERYMPCPTGHNYGQNEFFQSFSKPNIQANTPTYWLRTSEVLFLRAEAALAWGGEFGDPETLYKEGIAMSFAENGLSNSVDDYLADAEMPVSLDCNQGSYNFSHPAPCQTTVQFEGDSEQKLEKIMIQKWLALYPNGQEAWTEWRRTGYPKLHRVLTNHGASQGATPEGGIRRMIYPQSFYSTAEDKAIYDAALKLLNNGQGAQDRSDVNLWWDCK